MSRRRREMKELGQRLAMRGKRRRQANQERRLATPQGTCLQNC